MRETRKDQQKAGRQAQPFDGAQGEGARRQGRRAARGHRGEIHGASLARVARPVVVRAETAGVPRAE
ncbi:hypothetical protein GCM10010508_25460 [Streptomyces naganishii JCM 4654]|uniref:Uncharacterized protein n=1 Tax=Streptomyces naganishii JCM 4654 TaxID=1306179 RepID=A0A918Y3A6_9ACTN|nr:hypothetical protein GCM10010508_25460 [Streptomyces naganishii JCM 4654]